jgi:hypothetical protein
LFCPDEFLNQLGLPSTLEEMAEGGSKKRQMAVDLKNGERQMAEG